MPTQFRGFSPKIAMCGRVSLRRGCASERSAWFSIGANAGSRPAAAQRDFTLNHGVEPLVWSLKKLTRTEDTPA
jgi:hypothetical protein